MREYAIGMMVLGILLSLGCVTPDEQPTKEELAMELENITEAPQDGLITASGNEDVSVVKIRAFKEGPRWRFPVGEHEDEFIEAGLHSDSFIRLNSSQLMLLDDEESVWIHPMIESGDKAVLFDAVYAREIDNCSVGQVKILGKEYAVQELVDDSSFESDDKWKMVLVEEQGCLSRIIVYLDGYFYDLEDDDQISLFRNDNTILFRFDGIGGQPYVEIIGTGKKG